MSRKFAANPEGLVAKMYKEGEDLPSDEAKMAMLPNLSPTQLECLQQLISPVWDGNLISKAGRSELVDLGLVSRFDGLNFCTQDGYCVMSVLGYLKDRDKFVGGKPWLSYRRRD